MTAEKSDLKRSAPLEKRYSLGPLPWSHDALKKAYWNNFVTAHKLIKEHPGFSTYEMLEELKKSLEIFLDHTNELLAAIHRFKEASQEPAFFLHGNRGTKDRLERLIRKSLFAVSSSAFALVDVYRRVSGGFEIEGYRKQVDNFFTKNPTHRFLQGLRNALMHKGVLEPGWQITWRPGEKKTQFIFKKDALDRFEKWHSLAKRFIEEHPSGIDLEEIVLEYTSNVQRFYDWFHDQIIAHAGSSIDEYLSCERTLNAEGSRSMWRIVLTEAIERRIDPYEYIPKYLLPSELEAAQQLPKGSKAQVDLIIQMADEYGACDAEIRSLVYRLFSITSNS